MYVCITYYEYYEMQYVFAYLFLITIMKIVIAELTDLDDIKYYEIVELRHIDENGRSRRDLSTFIPGESRHLEETAFTFFGHGRYFHLKIHKNNFLIPDSFANIYQNSNGSYRFRKKVHNCYYHGYLVDRSRSFAAVNTCFGLKGVIRDDDHEEFIIEPHPLDSTENINTKINPVKFVLFKSKDVYNKTVKSACGVTDTQQYIMENLSIPNSFSIIQTVKEHRISRRSNVDTKYVETIVVLDKLKFKEHKESIDATQHRAFEIFNLVDSIYKTVNTRVAVVNMVIWNIYNMATVSPNAHETLTSFELYTREVLRNELKLTFDNAQLISTQPWANLAGLAGVGVICTMTSSAVNRDHNSNPAITANTVAHEMGHNIGFMHNTNTCVCHTEPCVMSSDVPWEPCNGFTDCSRNEYDKRLTRGDLPCLLDFPGKLYGKSVCGNGYLEEGEECDCGGEMECKKINLDKCCNFTTCTLQKDAQCAMGPCCESCMFKRRGTLCRGKMNDDCDLEEFCSGKSGNCPKNFHLQDGTSCGNGIAYCYQGACKTHETQCQMLWGINATKADDVCFRINVREGSEWGNCGKNNRGDYIQCKEDDELCGKLQCTAKSPDHPLPKYPIIGHDRARRTVTFHIGSKSVSCILGSTTVSADLQDPTMTDAGAKCGNNMICVDHKCTNTSSLSHVKMCSKICLNYGGVCNNNGNCHCPKGKACPYCEIAGPGGSADSGQGCILHDNCGDCFTMLAKGLMVLFLLVLPVIIVSYLCYRNRVWIRDKFCGERQMVNDQWSSEGMSDKEIGSDGQSNESNLISPMEQPPSSRQICKIPPTLPPRP